MSGGSLCPTTLALAINEARQEGFVVEQSNDTTLLLDLDSEHAEAQFLRVLPIVDEHYGVKSVDRWASKSGNKHVKIVLHEPHDPGIRFALQACLGSDGVREVLTLVQMRNGCVEPSVLFRP